MRGRKPLPTLIKQAKGTLRKHRINPREPKPQQFLGEPPEHLSDGAKEAWRYAIKCAPPGLLSTLDGSILMIWACAADLHNKAQQGLAKTGVLIKSPEGGIPMQSPYLAIANKQAQIMAKAATEMGFTPASRSRVSIASESADDLAPPGIKSPVSGALHGWRGSSPHLNPGIAMSSRQDCPIR
jgi:P27 family predicted phage terminase small subunit